ncbi:Septin-domain-containing protein [Mycotypha africana]|uniref:Septin-domain-containing protein n=1 Tax=Mycotypha africana TaxID=64632 RepID=UPI0023002AFD|nr:Septin-domain-containing protein [Mycotypha africana]KAI8987625.1 Septin-domain-containing protein [Mycotypha africana]
MVPRPRKSHVSNLNIMVVGFTGVGKTAFVRTLLETLSIEEKRRAGNDTSIIANENTVSEKQQIDDNNSSNNKKSNSRRDSFISEHSSKSNNNIGSQYYHDEHALEGPIEKTLQPYTISREVEVVDKKENKVLLTLIDTPGFSAEYLVDRQLHDILKYIEHQFDLTLAEESKVKRNPRAVDTQVHCCLYFIDPRKASLDEFDIHILKKLANRVNVIPIIGKADQLTIAQRNRLKPAILKDIYTTFKIPIYGMPEDEDDNEDIDDEKTEDVGNEQKVDRKNSKKSSAAEKKRETLEQFLSEYDYNNEDKETQSILDYLYTVPFTFIAYEENPQNGQPVDMTVHKIQLGRDFGWGTIDCLDDKYSDFMKLKHILLSSHRRFLQLDTVERHYEQYRTERLMYKRATKMNMMSSNNNNTTTISHNNNFKLAA